MGTKLVPDHNIIYSIGNEFGETYLLITIIPAHDPYFLSFILEMPKGARKKALMSPARAFRAFNVNQDSQRTPITATPFLVNTSHHACTKLLLEYNLSKLWASPLKFNSDTLAWKSCNQP